MFHSDVDVDTCVRRTYVTSYMNTHFSFEKLNPLTQFMNIKSDYKFSRKPMILYLYTVCAVRTLCIHFILRNNFIPYFLPINTTYTMYYTFYDTHFKVNISAYILCNMVIQHIIFTMKKGACVSFSYYLLEINHSIHTSIPIFGSSIYLLWVWTLLTLTDWNNEAIASYTEQRQITQSSCEYFRLSACNFDCDNPSLSLSLLSFPLFHSLFLKFYAWLHSCKANIWGWFIFIIHVCVHSMCLYVLGCVCVCIYTIHIIRYLRHADILRSMMSLVIERNWVELQ